MRFLFFILLISSGWVSYAEVAPQKGRSGFETLVDWYNYGTPIGFAQLKGFWAGRCFAVNDQDKAIGQLLGYGTRDGRSGPVKMASLSAPSNGTDYYDNPDHLKSGKQGISDFLMKTWNHVTDVADVPTTNYSVDADGNGSWDEKHEFVRYSSFIVQKTTALQSETYEDIGPKIPGDILGMCYYFKKVDH